MTEKKQFKILVSDKLGEGGLNILKKEPEFQVDNKPGLKPEELKAIIGEYDAIVIRSGTQMTKDILEAAKRLTLVGRAGVGVDNVDMPTATKQGIVVMNTPDGNTISTAEHSFSMLMALARNIAQANESIHKGEWKRAQFMGTELNEKTLGVIGLGRIGREVAKRAIAFGMRVIGYDPYISAENVGQLGIEVVDLDTVFRQADFITLHVPKNDDTKNIINAGSIAKMKKGVSIINCARGGLVDEQALCDAIQSGQVKGAALDVFAKEPPENNPLLVLDHVIATPHLGASTEEAQENVAIAVAQQVADALLERGIRNAVNMPSVDQETLRVLKPWIRLAECLGLMQAQLFGGRFQEVSIRYGGEITNYNMAPLTIAVLKGLLEKVCDGIVNFVNAPAIAKERGIAVSESKTTQVEDFSSFITVEVKMDGQTNSVMGTLFGKREPRIVRINEFFLEMIPRGVVLSIHNEDLPGVVGTIGSVLGKNKINIAEMTLGRVEKKGKAYAMTVINTDQDIPAAVLDELKAVPPIIDAKVIHF
ncbi:MAG: phosphoglycerate dehydrogenase [Omnitrophica bacterium RIFCSPLOWO2_12_FULL_44_17]|uniref:D-3-phosphoglycerate dehydrogenase n=1 Tax=Candidatus Danuiimicrobium aquiferis TaxID=1801832 RepID=A0A1G1KZ23_9BACT|nr:MAG: phosphoglycerate dehydrogenase [Omnitrophica bacterium RIFCSPHIGHO2_02_FULL_45_28]OGW88852.1 MAG: phosphoglycerate dehydrogenase [Omnitrophica bacterium RIFCSPHIGHO2_12_FULL_44_12]OGW98102.1 MAG: phosphoglycerate dehydrogenase [Omnitrophica bacterium RIFCSPLOWO2_12_FULL_44_17]OGX03584.1 MAG: phosphoglycerate dehydrogenase [Omnitrophica bacterium RIFCSPLOWO2_02_FULL_44_11]